MDPTQRKLVLLAMAILLTAVFGGPAAAQTVVGNDWEKFFEEKVSFGGFVENTTGFSISRGSRFFNTSNRFIMNRFTLQPEFNFDSRKVSNCSFPGDSLPNPLQRRNQKPGSSRSTGWHRPSIACGFLFRVQRCSVGGSGRHSTYGWVACKSRSAIQLMGRNGRSEAFRRDQSAKFNVFPTRCCQSL